MAKVRCSVHGDRGAALVCVHIEKAMLKGEHLYCNAIPGDSMLLKRFWLCESCKIEWNLLPNEDDRESFIGKLRVVCVECFEIWRNPPSISDNSSPLE